MECVSINLVPATGCFLEKSCCGPVPFHVKEDNFLKTYFNFMCKSVVGFACI